MALCTREQGQRAVLYAMLGQALTHVNVHLDPFTRHVELRILKCHAIQRPARRPATKPIPSHRRP